MKKVALLLLVFPLFFSATSVPLSPADCNCPVADTIDPTDTMRRIVANTQAQVTAYIASKTSAADSLRKLADSLAIEVQLIERKLAPRVLGRVDRWRAPEGLTHEWRWYYIRVPHFGLQFDTVIKRTYAPL